VAAKLTGPEEGLPLKVAAGDPWSHSLPIEQEIMPPVDIFETEDELLVEVELPGVAKDAVSLSVSSTQILVEGVKIRVLSEEGIRFSRVEQSFGRFRRIIDLPRVINTVKVKARLANGLLTITLPKIEDRRGRKFRVDID
jgi:HSP20 family protein